MNFKLILISVLTITVFLSCKKADTSSDKGQLEEVQLIRGYDSYLLTTDMSMLSDNEKKMIPLLIDACDIMNELFWYESFGDAAARKDLMDKITDDEDKKFITINYGPWDRLDGNISFIKGIDDKPAGANFYPTDMTKEEFEKADIPDKTSLYTFIRRNEKGDLISIPYHKMFPEQVAKASELLKKASEFADDAGLKNYLELRSQALLNDDYQPSDMAWLDMKTNKIDVVIGPIENYEDHLFGYKAAHEGYVLVKDLEWSKKLEKFGSFLPELQRGLPVPEKYKTEEPGRDTELNAYDVVYYAGDCNAGSKTIAINLPNDEEVQLAKGTRRLQLKNAMRAKYDKVLLPIADELIVPEQRKKINFDAFFTNTMFHEVAHGLGIKNTINGKGMVRKALKELSSGLEEGKADMLGLYMVKQLHNKGEISGNLEDYYITFATSIFRSIRFGAASAHGKANMIRFNYFVEQGAINRNEKGQYSIDFEKFEKAMQMLSEKILTLQGDGDYDGVAKLVEEYGLIHPELQSDLDKLAANDIPVDLIFEQGKEVLGL